MPWLELRPEESYKDSRKYVEKSPTEVLKSSKEVF